MLPTCSANSANFPLVQEEPSRRWNIKINRTQLSDQMDHPLFQGPSSTCAKKVLGYFGLPQNLHYSHNLIVSFCIFDQTHFQLGPLAAWMPLLIGATPKCCSISSSRRYLISRVGRSDYAVTHNPVRQSCKCWDKEVHPLPPPTDELVSYRVGRSKFPKCKRFVNHLVLAHSHNLPSLTRSFIIVRSPASAFGNIA